MSENPAPQPNSSISLKRKRWTTTGRGSKVFTLEHQERFIKKWLQLKSVEKAARAVGFREDTIYKQKHRSKRFAAMYDEAFKRLVAGLGGKMLGFAYGTELPTHNAQLTSMFGVLKAYEPERWRENVKMTHDATGSLAALFNGMAAALPDPNKIPESRVPVVIDEQTQEVVK